MFSAVVAFAFRLINLCALVFLAVYVFKKYLLNSLEDAVSEQEAFETGLKQQQGMLESRLDEGKQEQRNLEKQCMLLKSKVDQWHINFKANEEKLNQTKKQILEQMAQRTDQQTMQLAQQTLTRLVMVQAIPQAQEKLQKYYENSAHAEQYIATTLSLLKRSGK